MQGVESVWELMHCNYLFGLRVVHALNDAAASRMTVADSGRSNFEWCRLNESADQALAVLLMVHGNLNEILMLHVIAVLL